jgi:hypothetical protein
MYESGQTNWIPFSFKNKLPHSCNSSMSGKEMEHNEGLPHLLHIRGVRIQRLQSHTEASYGLTSFKSNSSQSHKKDSSAHIHYTNDTVFMSLVAKRNYDCQ